MTRLGRAPLNPIPEPPGVSTDLWRRILFAGYTPTTPRARAKRRGAALRGTGEYTQPVGYKLTASLLSMGVHHLGILRLYGRGNASAGLRALLEEHLPAILLSLQGIAPEVPEDDQTVAELIEE